MLLLLNLRIALSGKLVFLFMVFTGRRLRAVFAALASKNASKNIITVVGRKSLLRMSIPAIVLGGFGGEIYGRISEFFNPDGEFIGF